MCAAGQKWFKEMATPLWAKNGLKKWRRCGPKMV